MAEEEASSSDESFDSDISISEDPAINHAEGNNNNNNNNRNSRPSTPTGATTTTTTTTTTTSSPTITSTTSTLTPPPSPSSSSRLIPKQGYVELRDYVRSKKNNSGSDKWKLNWLYLDGASLHIYKNYEKSTPALTIDLRTLEIVTATHHNRQFSFAFTTGEHQKWVSCCTAAELGEWRDALEKAKTRELSAAPDIRPIPASQRTTGPFYRIKKSVAGRAATSKMGEVMLMKMFGDEVHHLFRTIKKIISKHHDKDTANEIHKILIRLTIKVAFLFEKKVLSLADITEIDRPLREALELLSKLYNSRVRRYMSTPYPALETFSRIEVLSKQAEDETIRKLQPYLKPKNLNSVHFLFSKVGSAGFLQKVWSDPDLTDELDELDDVITAYTQFHI